VEPADSDTPEKTENMTSKPLYLLFFLLALLAGCSGVKKTSTPALPQKSAEAPVSEQKMKEFEYLFIEALKQKTLGNPQRAVSLFASCLEIDPNSTAAMYELANLHVASNDLTSAALLLEKAISINNSNKWYKLILANIYQQTKKYAEAAQLFDQLLKEEPENHEYLYMKAMLYSSAKNYDEAIRAFNELEKKVGLNEQISVAKEQVYLANGKTKEAFAELQKLINSNPSEPRYYGLLADLYLDQGDKENALKHYRKILEMDPDNGYVQFSLATFYREQGDSVRAFEHTKLGFSSQEVDIETKLQLYLLMTGENAPAKLSEAQNEELIKILLDAHPADFRVYMVYAEFLIRRDRNSEAREQLLKVIDLGNNEYLVWEQILYLDNDQQDWNSLYQHSKNVINLFPNQPQVYFLHAVACLQLEKLNETVAVAEEGMNYVVDNPPLKGQFLMLKGEASYKLGMLSEAFELFDQAIKLDPDNFIAQNNYAYYLSLESRDLEKAERMSGRVVERFPTNPTYLDTHAWVLFKKKNYTLAKFYMETALSNGGSENPTLLEHYGDILMMLEKTDEALDYWNRAKQLGSDSATLERKIKEKRYIDEKK